MSDQPYILYGGGITRAIGVQMMLKELALDYELKTIDIRKDEHRKSEFLAINPAGYLPALVTPEGETLHETAAIMLWLADKHAPGVLAPAPDEADRGRFLSWFFFFTSDIQPPMKRIFYPERYVTENDGTDAVFELACNQARERWTVLEGYLSENGPLHLGERFTVADMQIAFWACYGMRYLSEIFENFPAITACYERASAQPRSGPLLKAFQQTVRERSSRPWLPK
ncbi:MAG: glutathione S-transferase family protein [Rhodospirillaceae bacterium]|jgi:glutathione S-transferase|nr:glutathione S-transferase family protein [Rhodospirillaceae bacterium]